jgi:hypothetical protein
MMPLPVIGKPEGGVNVACFVHSEGVLGHAVRIDDARLFHAPDERIDRQRIASARVVDDDRDASFVELEMRRHLGADRVDRVERAVERTRAAVVIEERDARFVEPRGDALGREHEAKRARAVRSMLDVEALLDARARRRVPLAEPITACVRDACLADRSGRGVDVVHRRPTSHVREVQRCREVAADHSRASIVEARDEAERRAPHDPGARIA